MTVSIIIAILGAIVSWVGVTVIAFICNRALAPFRMEQEMDCEHGKVVTSQSQQLAARDQEILSLRQQLEPKLRLFLGEGGSCMRETPYAGITDGNPRIERCFQVGIENVSSVSVQDIELELVEIFPPQVHVPVTLGSPRFSLNPGGKTQVDAVRKNTSKRYPNEPVELCSLASPQKLSGDRYNIVFQARGHDTVSRPLEVLIYIDNEDRLRFGGDDMGV